MPLPAFIPLLASLIPAVASAKQQSGSTQIPAQVSGAPSGINPMTSFFTQFDQMGRPKGGPPPVSAGALKTQAPVVQPAPTTGMQEGAQRQLHDQDIGDILSSIPEALAMAAPLLGLNDEGRRQLAPTAGGGGNNPYGTAFGALPRPPSLGELLAALPRMR